MKGRAARVAHLEAQTRAGQNRGRVPLALRRLSDAHLRDLEDAVSAAGGTGLPVHPWEDLRPGLSDPERAAWQWARAQTWARLEDVWTRPPAGAADVFQLEAARLEGLEDRPARHARAAWAMLAALAAVMLEEGTA
ncbi:hypothetical protein [Deinococcus aquaticus]|uniref:Uncharacterized protein n=1 Tax=Deinococcus aquaticus TaxID=328692 RepID=A0ABY7UZ50_9DEIO|nr:hypothetical protein [Deinococcus aquaticus]WDA57861.1 hypothetical protein M8445_10920 [Deinococcus aquaticus]